MSESRNLDERIKEKLAEHRSRVDTQRNHLEDRMKAADQRQLNFTAVADHLSAQVIRPRLEKLIAHFDNAELVPAEQAGRHQVACVFEHTSRFPARARLELGLTRDALSEQIQLLYQLQILPIFFEFRKHDELWLPLEGMDEGKVATWFDDKIVDFLDAYLQLETHEQYQAANLVTDPVCGMTVNKNHASAQLEHRGRVYYFCVPECQKKFAADPSRYLTGGPRAG
jgi:YHS domain-containing protein